MNSSGDNDEASRQTVAVEDQLPVITREHQLLKMAGSNLFE
jgi:hypothetical protein